MGFERWGYTFQGAFSSCEELQPHPGIYVIWCMEGEKWTALDVGESENVQDRVRNHEHTDCWKEHCKGTIYYSAVYTPNFLESVRKDLQAVLRENENPLCGER